MDQNVQTQRARLLRLGVVAVTAATATAAAAALLFGGGVSDDEITVFLGAAFMAHGLEQRVVVALPLDVLRHLELIRLEINFDAQITERVVAVRLHEGFAQRLVATDRCGRRHDAMYENWVGGLLYL